MLEFQRVLVCPPKWIEGIKGSGWLQGTLYQQMQVKQETGKMRKVLEAG